MKILNTIVSFYPFIRGSINQVYLIASSLARRGIEAPVVTTYQGAGHVPPRETIDGIDVRRYQSQLRIFSYNVTMGMTKAFTDFDLIHAHEFRTFQTDLGWLMSRLRRKPFIINTHGTLLAYKDVVRGIMPKLPYILYDIITMKNNVKKADRVIVSSKIEYDEAVNFGINKDKLCIIPYAIDSGRYLRSGNNSLKGMREDPDQLVLLFVGRIARCRNLELIIEAVKMLRKAVLIIVGDENLCAGTEKRGYVNELKHMVKRYSLEKRVKFIGWRQGDDLIDCFLSSDIFIYPSMHESFGLPILEAAASGLPVIATKVGGVPDLIQNGKTGFLVDYDAKEIAARVAELSEHAKRKEMGRNLQRIVTEYYDIGKIIEKYIGLYHEFC